MLLDLLQSTLVQRLPITLVALGRVQGAGLTRRIGEGGQADSGEKAAWGQPSSRLPGQA